MKNHKCSVDIVCNSFAELQDILNKYYKTTDFKKIEILNLRESKFGTNIGFIDIDYRFTINFECRNTKNEIYKINNSIKANPIKFR
jgi:hypothetical protein